MATAPYQDSTGKWVMDVDPDDHNAIVANVANDLTDRATTAQSVEAVLNGVTVLQGPQIQGTSLMAALVTIDQTWVTANPTLKPSITFRVTCADGQRFDRTIYFNLVSN